MAYLSEETIHEFHYSEEDTCSDESNGESGESDTDSDVQYYTSDEEQASSADNDNIQPPKNRKYVFLCTKVFPASSCFFFFAMCFLKTAYLLGNENKYGVKIFQHFVTQLTVISKTN